MKVMNWVGIEESMPIAKPPAGGYIIRIVDIEDKADREYLNIVYDIAAGPYAGFYSDDFGVENPWAHRFVRSYKASCEGMFKAFLKRLEESNPDFSIERWSRTCDPLGLLGLVVGAAFQFEDYTNEKGEDKERVNLAGLYSVDDIEAGNYKVPERKDSRAHAGVHAPAAMAPVASVPVAPAPAVPQMPVPAPPRPVPAQPMPSAQGAPMPKQTVPPMQQQVPVQSQAPQLGYPSPYAVPTAGYDPNIPF